MNFRLWRIALAVAGAAILPGCATVDEEVLSQRSTGPCPSDPGGWCDFTREIAERVWPYAQMATNAYEASADDFELPPGIVTRYKADNDGSGFAYQIFDRLENGRLAEVIVAFRGTEGFADWLHGNLLGRQNRKGLRVVETVFAQLDEAGYRNIPVTVTGHSLGGGIAHYVSLRQMPPRVDGAARAVAASYVFNNSPRYWRGPAQVPRIAVVERGEVLTLLRGPANEATQRYLSINCQPGYSPIGDHNMRRLAECLTWIAAFDDPAAKAALRSNPGIGKPPSQQNDDDPRSDQQVQPTQRPS